MINAIVVFRFVLGGRGGGEKYKHQSNWDCHGRFRVRFLCLFTCSRSISGRKRDVTRQLNVNLSQWHKIKSRERVYH